jgi:phthiocerol/phenolphthiocerol synthesis type-I polyketide synthase E
VNNDGSARIGYAAPGVEGQYAVIRAAQEMAGVDPATIGYVEAHGAGTPLGDPIEVAALSRAFRTDTARRGPCWIGSVKTNVGHTDTAAGVAGFIKAVLAVERGQIPASLHFTEPNSEIDFDSSPFRVSTRLREWPYEERPRRAGVSSFGLGGTNAHVVLEEPPKPAASEWGRGWQLLILSAKTPRALDVATAELAEHLASHPGLPLADVAWTLQVGREEHSLRRFAVVRDDEDAAAVLAEGGSRVATGETAAFSRPVALVFPGENAADAAAGSDLYATEPVFRAAIDECRPLPAGAELQERRAALFAFEYALARLWTHWGVQPNALVGEGLGAFVAAAVAGVFSPQDALRLVVAETRRGSELADVLRSVERRPPTVLLLSEWQGRWLSPEAAIATDYWAAHPGATANPREVLATLLAEPGRILLELGPGRSAVTSVVRDSDATSHLAVVGTSGAVCDLRSTLTAAGELWIAGSPIFWPSLHAGESRRRVPLPTYPFERRRWIVEREEQVPDVVTGAVTTNAPPPPEPVSIKKEVRQTVAGLFAEILALEEIDADESFFDVGGDSLIAAQLLARAHEEFPVQLDLRTVFEAPTVNQFAALIAERMVTPSATDGAPAIARRDG